MRGSHKGASAMFSELERTSGINIFDAAKTAAVLDSFHQVWGFKQ